MTTHAETVRAVLPSRDGVFDKGSHAALDALSARLAALEEELRKTREALWMAVNEDDHKCAGKCPDLGYENSRDPNCAACAAMDLPDSPLMTEFRQTLARFTAEHPAEAAAQIAEARSVLAGAGRPAGEQDG